MKKLLTALLCIALLAQVVFSVGAEDGVEEGLDQEIQIQDGQEENIDELSIDINEMDEFEIEEIDKLSLMDVLDMDAELDTDALTEEEPAETSEKDERVNVEMLQSNNTYIINGKSIYPTMVADPGNGQCWAYANGIYSIIWGVRFDSTFSGSSGTGYNMLRNLSDGERTLTADHLKDFIRQAALGASIRIGGCTSSCSQFNNDGLTCGHSGHSLILVSKNDSGFTTFERLTGPGRREKTWTWDSFCSAYSGYPYIKYIKWPGAGEYSGTKIQLWGIEEKSEWSGIVKLWAKRGDNDNNHYAIFYIDDVPITGHISSDSNGFFSVEVDTRNYKNGNHQLSIYYANTAAGDWDVKIIVFKNIIQLLNIQNGTILKGIVTVNARRFNNDNNHYAIFYIDDAPITGHISSDSNGIFSTDIPTSNYDNGNHKLSIYYACSDYGGWDTKQVVFNNSISEPSPSPIATVKPTIQPTAVPTAIPTTAPTVAPTATPTVAPTAAPSAVPTAVLTAAPTAVPTTEPTAVPTVAPTAVPTTAPTTVPTVAPTITPTAAPTVEPVSEPVSLKLNNKKATLYAGLSLTLKATVKPSKAKTTLTWTSSNSKVAKVSKKGVVKALKKGTAIITVTTANGKKATCKITVPAAPTKVTLNKKKATLKVGKKLTLKATLTPTKAKTALTWTSSNKKVATVSKKGVVKAIKPGKAKITVKTANGKKATVTITVKK